MATLRPTPVSVTPPATTPLTTGASRRASEEATEPVIYLDHHATTPCDPRVVEAMLPCFGAVYGNPASRQHATGQAAARQVDTARVQVASLLASDPREIVFTSGATESNNLAIRGVAEQHRDRRVPTASDPERLHLITAATEHKAVLDVCARLEREGFDVTYLGVEADGRVSPEAVAKALRPTTVLVSLMLANNEIGVLNPIAEIARRCRDHGVLLHCDAAQALAQVDCRVDTLGVDLLSISGHKAYGPKGVGALFVRRRRPRVRLQPQILGGGHEAGRRSGTLNVPGIVGLGAACALVEAQRDDDSRRLGRLRDRLLSKLLAALPGLQVNGSLEHRLSNNLNVALPGLDAEHLLSQLQGVAISSGAACSSANHDASYVLKALPGAGELAESSLRFGLGRGTTESEVDQAAERLIETIDRLEPRVVDEDICGAPCAVGAR